MPRGTQPVCYRLPDPTALIGAVHQYVCRHGQFPPVTLMVTPVTIISVAGCVRHFRILHAQVTTLVAATIVCPHKPDRSAPCALFAREFSDAGASDRPPDEQARAPGTRGETVCTDAIC